MVRDLLVPFALILFVGAVATLVERFSGARKVVLWLAALWLIGAIVILIMRGDLFASSDLEAEDDGCGWVMVC
jgi:hypothetical protein